MVNFYAKRDSRSRTRNFLAQKTRECKALREQMIEYEFFFSKDTVEIQAKLGAINYIFLNIKVFSLVAF
jgi:hypothetical protein